MKLGRRGLRRWRLLARGRWPRGWALTLPDVSPVANFRGPPPGGSAGLALIVHWRDLAPGRHRPPASGGPLDSLENVDSYDELRKKMAIKCDLCAGYKDKACVEACPTGAAIRIQRTKFFGPTEEILRRRAM